MAVMSTCTGMTSGHSRERGQLQIRRSLESDLLAMGVAAVSRGWPKRAVSYRDRLVMAGAWRGRSGHHWASGSPQAQEMMIALRRLRELIDHTPCVSRARGRRSVMLDLLGR